MRAFSVPSRELCRDLAVIFMNGVWRASLFPAKYAYSTSGKKTLFETFETKIRTLGGFRTSFGQNKGFFCLNPPEPQPNSLTLVAAAWFLKYVVQLVAPVFPSSKWI